MDINYDKQADAIYIAFWKGKFSRNRKIYDNTIIDLDKKGNILGIELLEVSKRMPEALSQVNVKNMAVVSG